MAKSTPLTEEKVMRIIARIPEESSLKRILKSEEVSSTAFFSYLSVHPNADACYSRSQLARAELHADEIVDIADTETDPQRARNRIDARKWYASKIKPSMYGDRIDLNINQTVDIGEALRDARARVKLPHHDLKHIESSQVIDVIELVKSIETDTESDANANPLESLDDIFK